MSRKVALLAVLVVAAVGVARADIDVIETRQAGQDALSGDYAGIKAALATKGDVKTLADPAKAIARWMRQYASLFPKGSSEGHNTRALPVIWTDMAGLETAANDAANAADKLAQLAKAGDAEGAAAQVKVLGDACAACHRTYRAR